MKLKSFYLPLSIILAGILFSIFLQWQVPDGVYFSGDAGLKALLAKQLGDGIFRFDLVPPSESWIQNLWARGLYPYGEPFVYKVAGKHYITFPFTFPLVTAPFKALFGYRGLYIIPLVSTWIIWFIFYWLCLRLKFNHFYISLALIALIFASPLTIYSAMYWEHTLAVALAFAGGAILLASKNSSGLSVKNAAISGVLVGLSVWFRPEFLCWVAISIGLVYFASLSQIKALDKIAFLSKNKTIFAVSAIAIVALFFLCNKLIYNHPLGIHAIQVVEKVSPTQKLKDGLKSFQEMSKAFFLYFPLAFFLLIYPLLVFLKNREIKLNIKLLLAYCICLLFTIGVALIVPPGTAGLIPGGKQWGVRFLLILIPIVALVAVKELSSFKETTRPIFKYIGISFISLLLLLGIYKNTFEATVFLQKSHQGILPAIEFVKKSPNKIIAISHQFVAQAIAPSLTQDKVFFGVENQKDLERLGKTLLEQDRQNFLYICYPHRPCKVPEEINNRDFIIQLSNLGTFGKYPIYEGVILSRSPK
jgi:hypothetical protein